MSKLIRELLTTPPQNDVEANHRARRLNLILLGSLVITLPAGFILSLFDFPRRINFLAFLVIEALGLLALLLLRRGNLQPASYLSILFLSGGLTHAALSNGGLDSPLLTTTILLIPAVGYLIGARPGTLFAVLTVVEITALYLKERSDHSLQPVRIAGEPAAQSDRPHAQGMGALGARPHRLDPARAHRRAALAPP